jgi:hypothetical protein
MQKLNQTESPDEKKVREYIAKYLKELQRHFDVSDRKMRLIVYKIYKDLTPLSLIALIYLAFVKKIKSMVKSLYRKIKR